MDYEMLKAETAALHQAHEAAEVLERTSNWGHMSPSEQGIFKSLEHKSPDERRKIYEELVNETHVKAQAIKEARPEGLVDLGELGRFAVVLTRNHLRVSRDVEGINIEIAKNHSEIVQRFAGFAGVDLDPAETQPEYFFEGNLTQIYSNIAPVISAHGTINAIYSELGLDSHSTESAAA